MKPNITDGQVNKILIEIFQDQEPVVIDQEHFEKLIRILDKRLCKIKTEVIEVKSYVSSCFYITNLYTTAGLYLEIKRNELQQLMITSRGMTAFISGQFDKLELFVKKIEDTYKIINAKVAKKEKLNSLKRAAISAKVQSIAKSLGFEYVLREFDAKMNLYVRIGKSGSIDIGIPYKNFQEHIRRVPEAIKAAYGMSEWGIVNNIKFKGQRWKS